MVLWELGKVSTGFITREERSRVGRRSPWGECRFLVHSIALIPGACENYLLVLTLPSFPREGWVASQISLVTTGMRVLVWLKKKKKQKTRAQKQENTGWSFWRKKEAQLTWASGPAARGSPHGKWNQAGEWTLCPLTATPLSCCPLSLSWKSSSAVQDGDKSLACVDLFPKGLCSSMAKKLPIHQGACLHLEIMASYYHSNIRIIGKCHFCK